MWNLDWSSRSGRLDMGVVLAMVWMPAPAARLGAALLTVKVPEPSFAAEVLTQACLVACFMWAGRSWLRKVK
jgi:hypothetical protein